MSMHDEHFDAVIVGSGFGGSINALRLAQAGKSVLILERGKRYKPALSHPVGKCMVIPDCLSPMDRSSQPRSASTRR